MSFSSQLITAFGKLALVFNSSFSPQWLVGNLSPTAELGRFSNSDGRVYHFLFYIFLRYEFWQKIKTSIPLINIAQNNPKISLSLYDVNLR